MFCAKASLQAEVAKRCIKPLCAFGIMRIIAGHARGRTLVAPPGRSTRPTPDRVREALFSMLGPYLSESHVLDVYAGSGALGLEALSRGAAHCTFVEHHPKALSCLRQNISMLKDCTDGRCKILACNVASAWTQLSAMPFDLIFMDPPYAEERVASTLKMLLEHALVADHGLIVCEHSSRQMIDIPCKHLKCWREKKFGQVSLTIFEYVKAV